MMDVLLRCASLSGGSAEGAVLSSKAAALTVNAPPNSSNTASMTESILGTSFFHSHNYYLLILFLSLLYTIVFKISMEILWYFYEKIITVQNISVR